MTPEQTNSVALIATVMDWERELNEVPVMTGLYGEEYVSKEYVENMLGNVCAVRTGLYLFIDEFKNELTEKQMSRLQGIRKVLNGEES